MFIKCGVFAVHKPIARAADAIFLEVEYADKVTAHISAIKSDIIVVQVYRAVCDYFGAVNAVAAGQSAACGFCLGDRIDKGSRGLAINTAHARSAKKIIGRRALGVEGHTARLPARNLAAAIGIPVADCIDRAGADPRFVLGSLIFQ